MLSVLSLPPAFSSLGISGPFTKSTKCQNTNAIHIFARKYCNSYSAEDKNYYQHRLLSKCHISTYKLSCCKQSNRCGRCVDVPERVPGGERTLRFSQCVVILKTHCHSTLQNDFVGLFMKHRGKQDDSAKARGLCHVATRILCGLPLHH